MQMIHAAQRQADMVWIEAGVRADSVDVLLRLLPLRLRFFVVELSPPEPNRFFKLATSSGLNTATSSITSASSTYLRSA